MKAASALEGLIGWRVTNMLLIHDKVLVDILLRVYKSYSIALKKIAVVTNISYKGGKNSKKK